MEILIKIENKVVILALKERQKVVDEISFEGEYQLSERLLPEIDKLLKKNKLEPNSVKIKSQIDMGKTFTSYRIIKTVEKSWNYGVACG